MSANTVDSGLGDLQPASFRGVPFGVNGDEARFGRSLAEHEYPFKDSQWMEDLGRGTRRFVIQGFLITDSLVYGGGDVQDQKEALIGAVETQGAGTLIHPSYGRLQVSVPEQGLIIYNRLDAGTYCEFAMLCLEAGEREFPSDSANQDEDALGAADDLDESAADDFFDDAEGPLGFGAFVGSVAVQTVTSWVDILDTVAGDVTGIFNMAASLIGPYGRFFNGALFGYSGIMALPGVIQTLESLVLSGTQTRAQIGADGDDLIAAAASLDPSQPAPVAQRCVADLVAACTNPADGVRLLTQLANFFPDYPNGPSVIGQASASMQTATGAMLRRAALAGLVRVAATYQPQSEADASQVRLAICDMLDAEAVRAGDTGDDASCTALARARGAVATILDDKGAQLPPMRQFTFAASMPALVLAQRLYQDPTRADQLVDEANPVNPLFMPKSFKALSS